MSANSPIEWTDASWNPVRGCARVSPGCERCYAERVAHRFSGPGKPFEGLTVIGRAGVRWTGEARFIPERLREPLGWQRARRIFVNSMSDLFHDDLTDQEIAAVFGIMAATPRHTYQVLTKRPQRMLRFFDWLRGRADAFRATKPDVPSADNGRREPQLCLAEAAIHVGDLGWNVAGNPWPLPNVHLGVSIEDQRRADERIPLLLEAPAAIRWASAEPLLGPITFAPGHLGIGAECCGEVDSDWRCLNCGRDAFWHGLDWLVVGGESGPGARPMELGWAQSIVDQCRYRVPVFFKQGGASNACAHSSKGSCLSCLPEELRVREMPREALGQFVGSTHKPASK